MYKCHNAKRVILIRENHTTVVKHAHSDAPTPLHQNERIRRLLSDFSPIGEKSLDVRTDPLSAPLAEQ